MQPARLFFPSSFSIFHSLTHSARPIVDRPPSLVVPSAALHATTTTTPAPARNAPAAALALASVQQLSAKCRGNTILGRRHCACVCA